MEYAYVVQYPAGDDYYETVEGVFTDKEKAIAYAREEKKRSILVHYLNRGNESYVGLFWEYGDSTPDENSYDKIP